MARPVQRRAAKAYPEAGIAAGEHYWYVKMKTGPRSSRVMRQKQPFKRSQLTNSDFLAQLYDWEDDLANVTCHEDVEDLVQRLRDLAQEQDDKYENMPEGLQQGDTGQLLEARRDACEAAADELEGYAGEWETAQAEHEEEHGAEEEFDASGHIEAVQGVSVEY